MAIIHGESIVRDNLIFCLDAADLSSNSTIWTDTVGKLAGTITGATYDSDNNGNMIFDGNNDEVTFGSAGADLVNGLAELTLEMWFKSDAINNDRGLIFGDNTSNDDDNGFSLRYDSAGFAGGGDDVIKASFGTNDTNTGSHSMIESSASIQLIGTLNWMNITVTCDVGTSINLYKNGALDTPTYTLNGGSQKIVSLCDDLVIGRGAKATVPGGGSALWDGKISIVRIYNRILTASEVLQNHNTLKSRFGL